MCSYDAFSNVELAKKNMEVDFVPGRQSVDMVFLLKDLPTDKLYVLLGKRAVDTVDFVGYLALPGGPINDFELVEDACVRVFKEETGLEITILEDDFVATPIRIENCKSELLSMKMVGIYSSPDVSKMGTRGGSSQCFTIYVEGDVKEYRKHLKPTCGLESVDFYPIEDALDAKLAFQHNEMLERAIFKSKAKVKWERDIAAEEKDTKVIYFLGGPGSGKSTAAYGVMFLCKLLGISCELATEFAKDSYYDENLRTVLKTQAKIIGEQEYRVAKLMGKVDFVVSDAPLVISAMHAREEKPLEDAAFYLYNKTPHHTIFIDRDVNSKYETAGRLEDEAKAGRIADYLKDSMESRYLEYETVVGSKNAVAAAMDYILKVSPEYSKKLKAVNQDVTQLLGLLENIE